MAFPKGVKKITPHNLPPKKTYKILPSNKHPSLYRIAFVEGGPIPSELDSDFNSRKSAQKFLDLYVVNRERNKTYLEFVRDKEYAESKD